MWKNKSQLQSFKCAFAGLKAAFAQEPHLRFHCFFSVLVVILSAILRLSVVEWLFIIVAIVMVIGSELLNSAIEGVVDLVTMEYHELAKYAKDVAAAFVICSAIGAVLIGCIIFIPKILKLIGWGL